MEVGNKMGWNIGSAGRVGNIDEEAMGSGGQVGERKCLARGESAKAGKGLVGGVRSGNKMRKINDEPSPSLK